jgi:hypothetical protein
MQRLITLGLLLSLLAVVSFSSAVSPRGSAQILITVNQYTAKFVCGKSKGELAAPGEYFTIINVHNPATDPSKGTVKFLKKFALGERDEHVGKISPYCQTSLKADEVMGIDCPNIYKHLGISQGTFIEGFAVIQTDKELDIVSVFTAGHDQVEAFHTERVPFRKVPPPVCSDLKLNISTSIAPWRITADPISTTTEPRTPNPPNVLFPFHWIVMNGSNWIGPTVDFTQVGVPRGSYEYELKFCLCPGFSNAKIDLKGLADDNARVSLNGSALNPAIAGPSSTTSIGPFLPGSNILKVVVNNIRNDVTGLNINGSINATAGRCAEACEGQLGSQP